MLARIIRPCGGRLPLLTGAWQRAADGTSTRWSHHDVLVGGEADVSVSPNLVQNLRAAGSSYELFEIVSMKRKEFGAEHVMLALKRLFHLQKNENTSIPNKHILKNPDFEHLCRNLKHVARTLDVNDIIESMKILNYVGVPPNSDISMTLLHLVRNQINDVSLGQIVFLEFLMNRFESTPLVDAFRIALPMLMQIQLGTKMDHDNPAQLTDLLQFVTRNPVSEQARMNIVSALTLHGTELSLDEARSVVWSLADLRHFGETHERLLQNCCEVLCDSIGRLPFDMVETTLAKMVTKYSTHRVAAFYDEEFFGRCAQYVIDKDVGFLNAVYIQRKFNRMNYVSVELIEYMADKMCAEPELLTEARPTVLLTIVSAMSTSFYRPRAWDTLKTLLRRNAFVHSAPQADMPWLRFALELVALDVPDVGGCVDAVCEPTFLKQTLHRSQHTLDMLQLLLMHQVVEVLLRPAYTGNRLPEHLVEKATRLQLQRQEMPLRASVERVFGGAANVHSAVVSRYGHFVDHVVVFDGQGAVVAGGAGGAGEEENVRLEGVRVAEDHKAVAIVTFPRSHYCLNLPRLKGMFHLRVRTLEALGVPVCVINADAWSELPDREKLDYVEREVRHKLA